MKTLKYWAVGDSVRQRYRFCRQGTIKIIGYDCDGYVEQVGFEVKTWFGKKVIWDKPTELMFLSTNPPSGLK